MKSERDAAVPHPWTGEQYNGWANYATWRVQLEYFADCKLGDFTGGRLTTISDLESMLKEHIEEIIEGATKEGLLGNLARGWAMAFIDDVRWREIADYLLEAEPDEEGEEE
jgi:hypothetical protein